MDIETFRTLGHQLVDWMADYRRDIRRHPVLPRVAPGDVRRALPADPPAQGEPFAALMADFERIIVPALAHWNHPRFFAYFPANNSEPSILAEMLTAAIGAQCMSWQTSPAATELEQVVMEWLRRMIGLPEGFAGVIHDTASTATLVAILMARERATGGRFRREGASAAGDRLRVYASTEAHSSVEKAVFLAGLGSDHLTKVPVDGDLAMDPTALAELLRADRGRGLVPAAVVATAGTTSTTAFDPLPAIGGLCREHQVFFHVDAAYAGSLAILPEKRALLEGLELADSFVFNPHKWLFTNFDCSAHFVKSTDLLLQTCAIDPEYLKTARDPEVVNFRDWGIPLGRRFRALKLWFVIRTYGVEGLRQRLRESLRLSGLLRARLAQDPRFELLAPAPAGLLVFRLAGHGGDPQAQDEVNARLLERINASGEAWLTHTRVRNRFALRLHTAQGLTTEADVLAAWEAIRRCAGEV